MCKFQLQDLLWHLGSLLCSHPANRKKKKKTDKSIYKRVKGHIMHYRGLLSQTGAVFWIFFSSISIILCMGLHLHFVNGWFCKGQMLNLVKQCQITSVTCSLLIGKVNLTLIKISLNIAWLELMKSIKKRIKYKHTINSRK